MYEIGHSQFFCLLQKSKRIVLVMCVFFENHFYNTFISTKGFEKIQFSFLPTACLKSCSPINLYRK